HLLLDASMPGLLSLADMPAAIAAAKTLGADRIVAPIFSITGMLARRPELASQLTDPSKSGSAIRELARAMTADDWLALAKRLNTVGADLAKAGIRLGYHTHNVDFAKLPNGDTVLDLLIANTDAKLVEFELDLGWVKAAGLDPATTLIRYADRVSQLHLKDLGATPANYSLDLNTAAFGAGVQDWPAIAEAIRRSSVRHLYVEQENPIRQSGLASAASCYAFIKPVLAKAGV
ncbi:MAG TPA: sugar phosphate isomerase/epimerase, partial [Sphingobium sp.]